ncbi:MAG TPA: nitroreductase [Xanthomonadales bacterium]|nr:nitroreductase [Xanthomonadales bacterium]
MLELLLQRRSTPARLLGPPGPDDAQLHALLDAAVRVPDHGRLRPWRFLRIHGDARTALGDVLARRRREIEPEAPDSAVEKDRQRFAFAPTIIAVIACPVVGHKVPESEQLASGAAVCFALLQAAHGLGFGGQWLTGWPAYDPVIGRQLGLAGHERILGFIHIGHSDRPGPESERPDPAHLLSDWQPTP